MPIRLFIQAKFIIRAACTGETAILWKTAVFVLHMSKNREAERHTPFVMQKNSAEELFFFVKSFIISCAKLFKMPIIEKKYCILMIFVIEYLLCKMTECAFFSVD